MVNEKNANLRNNLYNRIYHYSKEFNSFKKKFTGLIVKLGLNSLFGIIVYLSIDLFKIYESRILLFLSITGAIIISFVTELIWENNEIKELKKQEEKSYRAFVLLNEDYRMAKKDIQARDEFLSIVSHELKTPLTIMLLKLHNQLNSIHNASLASFSVPELVAVLKNSEQQIKLLKSVINDLVDVSLITTGRMSLQLDETNLVAVARQVKDSFSEVLKKQKYKLNIRAKASVIGKWDRTRLEQVVTNLFSNAIKYGKGKPIDVQIYKRGNSAMFLIKDGGMGIPSEEQKIIFDLFKRADGPKEYKKGLGVGLFIASQIIGKHGGRIDVSSIPTKGASFKVELPLNKG